MHAVQRKYPSGPLSIVIKLWPAVKTTTETKMETTYSFLLLLVFHLASSTLGTHTLYLLRYVTLFVFSFCATKCYLRGVL